MKCEWSLLASKQSYYHLHLLFYQLPLRQITLSSHNHDDQSRLWAALSSGRTRSFSLTWRLPQESHQTSQVMLHWSEKCKTYTKDWDWEWTHFWDTFVAKFGIYTEWGGSFTFGIKQEDKTASTNHPESARLHQHLQPSSYPLPSWRFAYLGDSLSSCPEQCLRGARTTQHTWILAPNIQFDIQKYSEKNADTVQKERLRQAVKSVLTNAVIVPRFNQSIFFTFSVLITNIVKLKIEKNLTLAVKFYSLQAAPWLSLFTPNYLRTHSHKS